MSNATLAAAPPHRLDLQAIARTWLLLILLALLGTALRYGAFLLVRGGDFSSFLDAMCQFDCGWYRGLALNGYATEIATSNWAGQTNWAFFPAYPLLAGTVTRLTGFSWTLAAGLVSTVALLAAAALSAPVFGSNRRAFWLFAFLLLVGPFGWFATATYSESLFILLTVLGFLALHRSGYVAAGFWGALLSATRVTGVLFAVAIAVQAAVDYRRSGTSWQELPRRLLTDRRLWLSLLLVPLGLLAYMVYLRFTVGDGLAFARIQQTWFRSLQNPFAVWWGVVSNGWPFKPGWGLLNTLALFVALATWLIIGMARAGRVAMAAFCLAALLLSVGSGLGSSLRFIGGLAPVTIFLAEALASRRWLTWATIPVGLVLGAAFAADWMLGDTLLA
jgi:hypothetical protein